MRHLIECPHCGEELTEEEYKSVCDCGCPSCRRFFEIEEDEGEPGAWSGGFADNH